MRIFCVRIYAFDLPCHSSSGASRLRNLLHRSETPKHKHPQGFVIPSVRSRAQREEDARNLLLLATTAQNTKGAPSERALRKSFKIFLLYKSRIANRKR